MIDERCMTIRRIERLRNRPHLYEVGIDTGEILTVHRDVLGTLGLAPGGKLTPEDIASLRDRAEFTLANHVALSLLKSRLRSEHELRIRLRQKEFHPAVIDAVLENLRTSGVVNDTRFARAYIHDMQLRNPVGKRLLKQKLRLKGVPVSTIEEVITRSCSPADERKHVLEVASKMLKRYRSSRRKIDGGKQHTRLSRYLAQRGFEWEAIRSAMKILFKERYQSFSQEV